MTTFSYLTLKAVSEGAYKEKGSKFLAFAFPVGSEEEVKERLSKLRKKYFDARHHCYGYVLGPEKEKYRAFDDGEPNHSAGDPILGQIRSKELTDTLIVVVRYFGGIKLGVGGLIQAYKAAAENVLANAGIIQKEVTIKFLLTYDYASTPEVMRLIKEFRIEIERQDFGTAGSMVIAVQARVTESFLTKVALLKSLGTSVTMDPVAVNA